MVFPVPGLNPTVAGPPSRADGKPASFETAQRLDTGVKEASDVVALPGNRFLVVGDTAHALTLVGPDGSLKKVKLPGFPHHGPSGLEGVAYDPDEHHLFLAREEQREFWRYRWNPEKNDPPELEKKFDLKDVRGPRNKGLEGLVSLSGAQSPTGRPQLLGVKEGKPRELVVFDVQGGAKPMAVKLEDQVKSVCEDFSAVAVDPTSGNLFIASDQSSTVAQVQLLRDGDGLSAKLVQAFAVRDEAGKPLKRVEGLTFNAKGDLFVLTENDSRLLRLTRR